VARKKKTSFKLATKITATFLLVFSLGVATWALTSSWKSPTDSKAAYDTLVKPIQLNEKAYNPSMYSGLGPFYVRGIMLGSYDASVLQKLISDRDASGGEVAEIRLGIGSIAFLDQLERDGLVDDLRNAGITTISYNPEGGHTPSSEFSKRFDDTDSNPIVQFAQWGERNGFKTLWAPLRADADSTSDNTLRRIYLSGIDTLGLQEQRFIEKSCPSDRYNAVRNTVNRHKNLAGKDIGTAVQIMAVRCQTAESLNCSESYNSSYGHCDKFVDLIANTVDTIAIWPSTGDLDLIKVLREGSGVIQPDPTGNNTSRPTATTNPNMTFSPRPRRSPVVTTSPRPTQFGENREKKCSLVDRFRRKCICRTYGNKRVCWKPSETSRSVKYNLKDYADILLDRQ